MTVSPDLLRLMDSLPDGPAFVVSPAQDILAANAICSSLCERLSVPADGIRHGGAGRSAGLELRGDVLLAGRYPLWPPCETSPGSLYLICPASQHAGDTAWS